MAEFKPKITYKMVDNCTEALEHAIDAAKRLSEALEKVKHLNIEFELEDD